MGPTAKELLVLVYWLLQMPRPPKGIGMRKAKKRKVSPLAPGSEAAEEILEPTVQGASPAAEPESSPDPVPSAETVAKVPQKRGRPRKQPATTAEGATRLVRAAE